MKILRVLIAFCILNLVACTKSSNRDLRGSTTVSKDAKTYLVIADNNGGGCGPIYVDNKIWDHKLNEQGEISAGPHKIKCGTEIQFEIPTGKVFTFDYWGP